MPIVLFPSPLNQRISFPVAVNMSGAVAVSGDVLAGRSPTVLPPKKLFQLLLLPPLLPFFRCFRSPSNSPAVAKSGLTIGRPPGPGGGGACAGGARDRDDRCDHRCAEFDEADELDLAGRGDPGGVLDMVSMMFATISTRSLDPEFLTCFEPTEAFAGAGTISSSLIASFGCSGRIGSGVCKSPKSLGFIPGLTVSSVGSLETSSDFGLLV